MTRKENIENMARIIANRVRYHAPVVYDEDIDTSILEDFGIDISIPVFKFEKEMTKPLMKAFALARKLQNFNLVTTQRTKCPFALFLPVETVNLRLMQMVNKLNINYKSVSEYKPNFEIDYLKINGKLLNLAYNDFCLEKHESMDGVLVRQRLFVCSGESTIIELTNSNPYESEITIDFNRNLEKGNYLFKKQRGSICAKNLFTQEACYLNTNLPLSDIFFSSVDGVETSCFACIRFSRKISLKPYQKRVVFINFGQKQFRLTMQKDMELLFDLAKKKCYENFDMRVFSVDKQYDEKMNEVLPRDIWLAWLNGERDREKEAVYVLEKEKVFSRRDGKVVFNSYGYENLREVDIYDGKEFREIYIKNLSNENSLVIGKASFQNLRSFSLDKIKSKTQICLHFK